MAFSFLPSKRNKKPDQIVAVDLGARTTKVVHVQRRGETYALLGYALLDAPISDKDSVPVELLGEHLKGALQPFKTQTKSVALAIGSSDSLVRHVEMPEMPMDVVRQVLKRNSRNYLQQDLSNYVFDCHVIYQAVPVGMQNAPKPGTSGYVQRLLVSGTKQQFLDDLTATSRTAGLHLAHVIPSLVCPANALEHAQPDMFKEEVVAAIEIGFKSSAVFILQKGELVLARVLNVGGHQLTTAIAEELKISYTEAEGIKIGMPDGVRHIVETFITGLGRELQASINYFEHQQDKSVSRIYLSGGSTRSELVMQILQLELMTTCLTWNPVANFQLDLPPAQLAEIEQVAPQLGVAIGAAIAAL